MPEIMCKSLTEIWNNGNVVIGGVNAKSINYTTKYMLNKFIFSIGSAKSFNMMSTKPPIGSNYLGMANWHKEGRRFYAVLPGGEKINLPRFYRDRIFNDDEKACRSWINQCDKQRDDAKKIDELLKKGEDVNKYFEQVRSQALARIKNKSKEGSL